MIQNAPWLKHYGDVPKSLDYPVTSMSELVLQSAAKYPDAVAYIFFGTKVSYSGFAARIDACARALAAAGIKEDERVTIYMPNVPQAVIMFYAVNRIGAVANMVHPLSAEEEIVFYINSSKSVAALTLDQFYTKFEPIMDRTTLKMLIVSGIDDGLAGLRKLPTG